MAKGSVERGDVRVLEAGQQLDLPKEASDDFIGYRAPRREDLHGFDAVRDGVADLIDLAHSTEAKCACYLIIADLVSNVNGHGVEIPFYFGCVTDLWRDQDGWTGRAWMCMQANAQSVYGEVSSGSMPRDAHGRRIVFHFSRGGWTRVVLHK